MVNKIFELFRTQRPFIMLLTLTFFTLASAPVWAVCSGDGSCSDPTRACCGGTCQTCSGCCGTSLSCCNTHAASCGWNGSSCYNDHITPELPEGMSWTFFLAALPLLVGYFLHVYRKRSMA
jgi:hypothetical protein